MHLYIHTHATLTHINIAKYTYKHAHEKCTKASMHTHTVHKQASIDIHLYS